MQSTRRDKILNFVNVECIKKVLNQKLFYTASVYGRSIQVYIQKGNW